MSRIDFAAIAAEYQDQLALSDRAMDVAGSAIDGLASYADNMGVDLAGLLEFADNYYLGNAGILGVLVLDLNVRVLVNQAVARAFLLGVKVGRDNPPPG